MENQILKIDSPLHRWWIFALTGTALLALGIARIFEPSTNYTQVSIYFVGVFIFDDLLEIAFALTHRKAFVKWGWYLMGCFFDLAAGAILIFRPTLATSLLLFFVGLWLLFHYVLLVIRSFELNYWGFSDWTWLLITALSGVAFSFIIVYYPFFKAEVVHIWTVLALENLGLLYIFLAIRLRTAYRL